MANIKFSQFPSTSSTSSGDSVVGLHSGANEQFLVSSSPTASGITLWDANQNITATNFLAGYATTATAAGNTVLTVSSAQQQYFTGTTTQTVTLPVTSTLVLGQSFIIVNNSSGVVTVNSSGGDVVQSLAASSFARVTCILTSGTTAASWSVSYSASSGNGAWVDQTTASVTMAVNTGYTSDAGASLITFTLPTTSAIGDYVEIVYKGSGGWTIAQGSGQQIRYGSVTTTLTTGTLSSNTAGDCVRLRCSTANTLWTVVSVIGNLTYV